MILGCIGDDFTGSSDLANTLSKNGMRTVQFVGIPTANAPADIEAGVVALKSRSVSVDEAVLLSLEALRWLQKQGCQQFLFKYCSTFDSTHEGNIGAVTDSLLNELGADYTIMCPAFPGAGRSIYQGHLFVKDALLNESGMQHHPLTPMIDADIRRWLQPQTQYDVGHVSIDQVLQGSDAVLLALEDEHKNNKRLIVVDAIQDKDLAAIGEACADLILITGGSGIAQGLPNNFRKKKLIGQSQNQWSGEQGLCVALSGSCSMATRQQITCHIKTHPALKIDVEKVLSGELTADYICHWLLSHDASAELIPLAYSSADPLQVEAIQREHGQNFIAATLEKLFADVARALVDNGVTKLITAGGETSGAILEGLDLSRLEVGPEIDPGVPALRAGDKLVVALKSGNFGAENFFAKAAEILSLK
jgi:uncharacterized protein YgbK (DUF1537 family)